MFERPSLPPDDETDMQKNTSTVSTLQTLKLAHLAFSFTPPPPPPPTTTTTTHFLPCSLLIQQMFYKVTHTKSQQLDFLF